MSNKRRLVCYDEDGKLVWSGYLMGITPPREDGDEVSYTITAQLFPDQPQLFPDQPQLFPDQPPTCLGDSAIAAAVHEAQLWSKR